MTASGHPGITGQVSSGAGGRRRFFAGGLGSGSSLRARQIPACAGMTTTVKLPNRDEGMPGLRVKCATGAGGVSFPVVWAAGRRSGQGRFRLAPE